MAAIETFAHGADKIHANRRFCAKILIRLSVELKAQSRIIRSVEDGLLRRTGSLKVAEFLNCSKARMYVNYATRPSSTVIKVNV